MDTQQPDQISNSESRPLHKFSYDSLDSCPTWVSSADEMSIVSFLSEKENTQQIQLGPSETSRVRLEGEKEIYLPPCKLSIEKDISVLQLHTRSRLAQAGVFFYIIEGSEKENNNGKFTIEGNLINHGCRKIILHKGDCVARFFYTREQDIIKGEDLLDLVHNGVINGREGEAFNVVDEQTVAIRVGEKRFKVKDAQTPLHIVEKKDLYDSIERIPIQSYENKIGFHLLETAESFDVPENVMGILRFATSSPNAVHLPSQAIDPGSFWTVRLEIYGDVPEWVLINFYSSPILKDANVRSTAPLFRHD